MQTELQKASTNESQAFQENIAALKAGRLAPDDFKKYRLMNGVYGIRGYSDKQMVRIRIPYGKLGAAQLEALANLIEKHSPLEYGHFTTRHNMQVYRIPLESIPNVLSDLARAGLTSREASGNTVRNVTACPFSGVHPQQVFDVTPHAEATTRFFLRNPLSLDLPRKIKIAFESCSVDHVGTGIHDIGAEAVIQNGQRGFRIRLGGGLGALPQTAVLLEDFTPEQHLLPTLEAIIRVFDRLGERQDKKRARLKFLVKKLGAEELQRQVKAERHALLLVKSGATQWAIDPAGDHPPKSSSAVPSVQALPDFGLWARTNVLAQVQEGFSAATVVLPQGDISPKQLRGLANISRHFADGSVRTTPGQNVVLRWVRNAVLPNLHAELAKHDLVSPNAGRLPNIVACPGAGTCLNAVTKSRDLAAELRRRWQGADFSGPEWEGAQIKISGCTNSCGHHHVGALGFYGTYKKVGERQVPLYFLLINGALQAGETRFGEPAIPIPSHRVPEALEKILDLYRKEKSGSEKFADFLRRIGAKRVREAVKELVILPDHEKDRSIYMDWSDTTEFIAQIGEAECAA